MENYNLNKDAINWKGIFVLSIATIFFLVITLITFFGVNNAKKEYESIKAQITEYDSRGVGDLIEIQGVIV